MNTLSLSYQFVVLAALIGISAFFSLAETSLMTLNRYRLKHLVSQGNRAAKLTHKLLSSTDKLLGVILLCKEFANAASAMFVTVITVRLYGEGQIPLMVGTLVTTFLILIFGEVSPKVIAASKPERYAFFCSYILYPLLKILYPIVIIVNFFVLTFVKIFNVKIDFNNNLHAISMDELRSIISEAGQFIPNQHRKILLNLFELERITVDDIMIPHTFVESIDFDLSDEEIIQKLLTFQHSRILVKTNSPESILGLLDTQKIIKQLNIHDALSKITKKDLEALITEPYFIPSGTPLYTQLQQFQDKQERIGLIVNEHGEFIGLLSLEDILEEVVGEFNLDFLSRSSKFSQDEDGGWIVDGSVTIRTLNKKLNLHFPVDGPKTLNGLVLEYFEDIPEPNTSFKIANHTLEVLQSHDRIVKSIKIYPLS